MTKIDSADIAQALRDDIIFGRLQPRERLSEDALMERFGASRHHVRQVLFELEQKGFTTRLENRGSFVREFSIDDLEQIYTIRELLQDKAARLIPLPAPPDLIKRLKKIQKKHVAAIERGDLLAIFKLNDEFHQSFFAACGNRFLADLIDEFALLTHVARAYRFADFNLLKEGRGELKHVLDEHALIIEALESGERSRFVKLCFEHIQPSKRTFIERAKLQRSLS